MAMASLQNNVLKTDETPVAKKPKLEEENATNGVHESLSNLSDFKIGKILHNNTNRKAICLQGTFTESDGTAIIMLEKTSFADDNFTENSDYFTEKSTLKKVFHNDIYGNYEFYPKFDLNSLKATIIHPATEKHIQKYSIQNLYLVDETQSLYEEVTLPHITKEQFDLQWVYNIIDHKSESDRIVFEDEDDTIGFILLPDLKWDGGLSTLYLLALVRIHNVKSLRDLTSEHLPLLRNIKLKGTKAIMDKYGLDASQLRVYLHYQPSFYHLHVHFTYLRHDAPGINAERSHLLSNVISNIEIASDYYQKVTLPFVLKESDNLFSKFEEKGILSKVSCISLSILAANLNRSFG
ncbi:hypothetical protein RN001_014393 [Aquatica leii]|uniref:m7GpppX diphosphatase n=1 Tax=Aquatica leii TaxID=1421715 RepID=A0AAN7NY01_9COLE|nr:hypothetical protein RN001_014393 [Aquatica leii]